MRARLKFLLLYYLYWLGFFAVARAVFLGFFYPKSASLPAAALLGAFVHGFRLDLSAAAYLSLLPFLLVALSAVRGFTKAAGHLVLFLTVLAILIVSLLVAADLEIFRNWGRRIDASVLIYVGNPAEAWASAGGGPRLLLLVVLGVLSIGFITLAVRPFRRRWAAFPPIHPTGGLALFVPAALLVIPARGGMQQIPINQSSAYFSANAFANQAALNVGWNFFDSWVKGLNRRDNPYTVMPADSARALAAPPPISLRGFLPPLLRTQRPNLLLVVWEGLTARAVERLGGVRGATPAFDSLAQTGLLFRRFYAAGDRTEKGLAALLSGAPTVPNASILMVPSKAATLPMLSKDLGTAGYQSAFYYGGELGFANLKGYVLEGQFGRVVGKEDFPKSSWNSKWGAHDGPVADRVLGELRGMRPPFFVTWLTLSSHEPFDVPGPIRVPGNDGESRFLNSLAYTDHVLGDFLRRASAEAWWDSTLVVIVADHSKKLERTDADVPYKSAASWYHVPMLWTGGALARRGENVDALASQVDLAPTLLAVLGIAGGERYRFGYNLFATLRPGAFYGFDDGFGLVTEYGSLIWEHIPNRVTSSAGVTTEADLLLGRAMLQLAYQDYLDR
ncbi:MAG: LTA synthase family protein [Gemmatimonadales bacterium]|nr:LTA synthase family protein [Gemmatimonadales bacterium]